MIKTTDVRFGSDHALLRAYTKRNTFVARSYEYVVEIPCAHFEHHLVLMGVLITGSGA
jgi:hypothetical protein